MQRRRTLRALRHSIRFARISVAPPLPSGSNWTTDQTVRYNDRLYRPSRDLCATGPDCSDPYNLAPDQDIWDPDVNDDGGWVVVEKSPLKGAPRTWKASNAAKRSSRKCSAFRADR